MKKHPTDEALLAYCEARDAAEGPSEIRSHLEESCERCCGRIETYREVLASFETPALALAPEPWVEAAVTRINELEAGPIRSSRSTAREMISTSVQKIRDAFEEIQMGLVLDSLLGAAPLPGIRGTTALEPRQLLYECPQGSLHMQIGADSEGRNEIQGQFLPAEGSLEGGESRAVLECAGRETVRSLSPLGEFEFKSVSPAPIQISLEVNGRRFVIAPLDLSAGSDA